MRAVPARARCALQRVAHQLAGEETSHHRHGFCYSTAIVRCTSARHASAIVQQRRCAPRKRCTPLCCHNAADAGPAAGWVHRAPRDRQEQAATRQCVASQEHAVRTRAARNSRGVRTRKQLERHVGKQTLHQRIARILYHDLRHVCMPPCALTGAGKRMALLLQAAAVRAVAGGNASARRCCARVRVPIASLGSHRTVRFCSCPCTGS